MSERHRAVLQLSPKVLLGLLTGRFEMVSGPDWIKGEIPPDVEVVSLRDDFLTGSLFVMLEHPSLPTAADGCEYYKIYPLYRLRETSQAIFSNEGLAAFKKYLDKKATEVPDDSAARQADVPDPYFSYSE